MPSWLEFPSYIQLTRYPSSFCQDAKPWLMPLARCLISQSCSGSGQDSTKFCKDLLSCWIWLRVKMLFWLGSSACSKVVKRSPALVLKMCPVAFAIASAALFSFCHRSHSPSIICKALRIRVCCAFFNWAVCSGKRRWDSWILSSLYWVAFLRSAKQRSKISPVPLLIVCTNIW